MNWSMILGALLLLYAVYVIYRGRIVSGNDSGLSSHIDRAEKPVQYWLSVALLLTFALILLLNIVHF